MSLLRREYSIYKEKLAALVARIETINRAAAKLSLAPVSLEIVKEYLEEQFAGLDMFLSPIYITHEKLDIVLVGEAPSIAGYELAAIRSRLTVENPETKAQESSILIRKFPTYSSELPAPYSLASHAISCEHCKQTRRRNDSYVLVSAEGKLIEVGSSCLAAFLGLDKVEKAARFASYLEDLKGLFSSSADDDYKPRFSESAYVMSSFLAMTSAVIRRYGFVSKSAAYEAQNAIYSTSELVVSAFAAFRAGRELDFAIDEQDKEIAAATIAFVKETLAKRETLNDYETSLVTLFAASCLPEKFIGLAASAVAAYQKHLAAQTKRIVESEYVETIGARVSFERLTIVDARSFDSLFGVTTAYTFQDAAGNLLTWFSSGSFYGNIGESYTGKATIDEHKVYREQKTTYLKRAKLARIEEPVVEASAE